MSYQHIPVLLEEVLVALQPKAGQRLVDGTLGAGGYTRALLAASAPTGQVMGIDLDPTAHAAAKAVLGTDAKRFIPIEGNFAELAMHLESVGWESVDGIVVDLGLSSGQLDQPERGFSFQTAEPQTLDMRFGPGVGQLTAGEILNTWKEADIADVLFTFGEERLSRPIAKAIVTARTEHVIDNPALLADLVAEIYRRRYRGRSKIQPATKVFQALRIAVNRELQNLEQFLPAALAALQPGGRLAVVSYHSLEDRIVKTFFRDQAKGCRCSPEQPTCTCGRVPTLRLISKKPIRSSDAEVSRNPRSRSALLRVAEKI